MNLWDFLDRRHERRAKLRRPQRLSAYRYSIGLIAILGGLAGLGGLYVAEVPEGNREALLLALGLVLGWGGNVVSGEWGSSPAGRKAADVGVRMAEKDVPVHGTEENPTVIEGVHSGEAITTKPERRRG